LLATADAYQAKLEPRPHRRALTPDEAAAAVRGRAAGGELDVEATEAVLSVAGHADHCAAPSRPSGLTEREAEVLGLLVQGLTNREMAERLVLSPKTVGRHVESIYAKIDVSTRVGATLFAVEHGLAARLPPSTSR
jgi:DNA-binding NarL/FixJ family response regulator